MKVRVIIPSSFLTSDSKWNSFPIITTLCQFLDKCRLLISLYFSSIQPNLHSHHINLLKLFLSNHSPYPKILTDLHDLHSIKSKPLSFALKSLTLNINPTFSTITSFLMRILFLHPGCSFPLLRFCSQSFFPTSCPQMPSSPHAVYSTLAHFRSKLSPLLHVTLLVLSFLWSAKTNIAHVTRLSCIATWLGGMCICTIPCISLCLHVYLCVKIRIYVKHLERFLARKCSTSISNYQHD